jgi:hypothetical protein
MPLDRRLREGLERSSAGIEPDVEGRFPAIVAGARRRVRLRRGAYAMLTVAMIGVVTLVTPRLIDAVRSFERSRPAGPGPAVSPSTTAQLYVTISGTYAATLDAGNAAVSRNGLAGRWTLVTQQDGALSFSAPGSFIKVPTISAFKLDGDRFTTNAFFNGVCNSVGAYTWTLSGGQLTFTPVRDTCELRRTLLSAQSWQRQG